MLLQNIRSNTSIKLILCQLINVFGGRFLNLYINVWWVGGKYGWPWGDIFCKLTNKCYKSSESIERDEMSQYFVALNSCKGWVPIIIFLINYILVD